MCSKLSKILFTIGINVSKQSSSGPYIYIRLEYLTSLNMVALKIFDVLIQAAHVYTVHILTDRNSKAVL